MKLKIHRGTHEVGGSCVELSHEDTTILLDIGLPLDYGMDESPESHMPQPLYSQLQKGEKSIAAVILSHAHLDHYGLVKNNGVASSFLTELQEKRTPIYYRNLKLTRRNFTIDFGDIQ